MTDGNESEVDDTVELQSSRVRPHPSSGGNTDEADSMKSMNEIEDDTSDESTDEQLKDYLDNEAVSVLFDNVSNWEARKGGEIIDSGVVDE